MVSPWKANEGMRLTKLAERISIKRLPLRRKVLLSFAVSSLLPLLTLFYLFFSLKTPEGEPFVTGRTLISLNTLFILVTLLSVLGVTINLNIVRSVRELLEKARRAHEEAVPQEEETDEIAQLSKTFSIIMDKMQEQMGLLSSFQQDLTTTQDQLKLSRENLKKLAAEDAITGLFNRRLFNLSLEQEVKRAKRYEHPLCLLMLDIDDFKTVNDRFGHQAGDRALRELADILKSSFRKMDIVARYGGEEFVVIFPEVDMASARLAAERLRLTIEGNLFLKEEAEPELRMTISIGIAYLNGETEGGAELLQKADDALNSAKRLGKNRIVEY